MEDKIITLDDLKAPSKERVELKPVSIDSIPAQKVQHVEPTEVAMDSLISELDIGINRSLKKLKEEIMDPGVEYLKQQEEIAAENKLFSEDEDGFLKEPQKSEDKDEDEELPSTDSKEEEVKKNIVIRPSIKEADELSKENPFNELGDNFVDFEDSDDDEDKEETISEAEQKENLEVLKKQIKSKLLEKNKIDLSGFKIKSKPISINRILKEETKPTSYIADWILFGAKRSFSISDLNGQEIEKFDPRQIARNRLNGQKEMYKVIYNHIIDENKPNSLEAWAKLINYDDIQHLFFGVYKACFESANYVPYSCNKCHKSFIKEINIDDMVKYESEDDKAKAIGLLNQDTTGPSEVEISIVPLDENFAVGLKNPTLHNVIFEMSVLESSFLEKYSDIVTIVSFIDSIYKIDNETQELIPISYNQEVDNIVKTVKRKIRMCHEVITRLSPDEYMNFYTEIRKFDVMDQIKVGYKYPETKCSHCGETIQEVEMDPQNMLFTRHQLAAIANS